MRTSSCVKSFPKLDSIFLLGKGWISNKTIDYSMSNKIAQNIAQYVLGGIRK
jgi:hypothetical protein